ncbi:hypothetical protein Tco_1391675 [Tanacetum coccineum]
MSENEDQYHDIVLNLKAHVKKNVDTVLKIGNSLQGMFMLGPKPMSFYDSKLKHGLGDTEDILKDATKSQIKMKNKMNDPIAIEKKQNVSTINYKKLNVFYEDFVPQKDLSTEQKYFPPSFISPEDPTNESSTYPSSETQPTKKQMPSANPILVDLNQMENDFQTFWKSFKIRFLRDIKEMKDVFEATESDLCETWKQNELLKDQLLEANLKHEIECCVLLSHECVDNNMKDEIEKV